MNIKDLNVKIYQLQPLEPFFGREDIDIVLLPTEIWVKIIECLDLGSYLAILGTCSYFRQFIDAHIIETVLNNKRITIQCALKIFNPLDCWIPNYLSYTKQLAYTAIVKDRSGTCINAYNWILFNKELRDLFCIVFGQRENNCIVFDFYENDFEQDLPTIMKAYHIKNCDKIRQMCIKNYPNMDFSQLDFMSNQLRIFGDRVLKIENIIKNQILGSKYDPRHYLLNPINL